MASKPISEIAPAIGVGVGIGVAVGVSAGILTHFILGGRNKKGDPSTATAAIESKKKVEDEPKQKAENKTDTITISARPPALSPKAPPGSEKKIYKIVLTGGPCGGKTTALATVTDVFQKLGWKVFAIPEAATLVINGGVNFIELSESERFDFQKNLLKMMFSLEDTFKAMAKASGKKCLLICDRGALDCRAYIKDEQWEELMNDMSISTNHLKNRYDGVVHLVTAANGAEKFYTLSNNKARSEGLEDARHIDDRLKNAWLVHQSLHIIDNSTKFQEKLSRAVRAMCEIADVPIKDHLTKRKYVVEPVAQLPIPFAECSVEVDFLQSESNVVASLKRIEQNRTFTYRHRAISTSKDVNEAVETKRMVNPRQYLSLKLQKDPKLPTLRWTEKRFHHKDYVYTLMTFSEPASAKGLNLLTTHLPKEIQATIPDFIKIVKDVSSDDKYRTSDIAKW